MRQWGPANPSRNPFEYEDDPEDQKTLLHGTDVTVKADALWRNVQFSIAGEEVENGMLYIYTTSGTKVLEHPFRGNAFTLDLSSLARRLYIFHLVTDNRTKDFKLMKTR